MPIKKLDYRNVLTLPAGASGRTQYTDATLPGFALRVYASGVRMYYAVYRTPGGRGVSKVRWVKLGPVARDGAGLELADARTLARAILGRVAAGGDPAAEKTAKRRAAKLGTDSVVTLGRNLIREAELSDSVRRNWSWTLKKYIEPKWGKRSPASITRGDVRELLASIKSKPVAKNARRFVTWIFSRAVEQDIVNASPCVGLGRPPKEVPRDRVLTHAELRDLWRAAGASGAYGSAIRWLMLTATRKEEAFAARRAEVDREAKVWRLPAARAKNRRAHDVPLTDLALEEFDGLPHRAPGDLIFGVTATSKAWRQLLTKAGIIVAPTQEANDEDAEVEERKSERRPWTPHPIRIHDLRRTVRNTLTHTLGVNFAVAEAVIGHKPPKLIETYAPAGVSLQDLRSALERWEEHLRSIVGEPPAPRRRR